MLQFTRAKGAITARWSCQDNAVLDSFQIGFFTRTDIPIGDGNPGFRFGAIPKTERSKVLAVNQTGVFQVAIRSVGTDGSISPWSDPVLLTVTDAGTLPPVPPVIPDPPAPLSPPIPTNFTFD